MHSTESSDHSDHLLRRHGRHLAPDPARTCRVGRPRPGPGNLNREPETAPAACISGGRPAPPHGWDVRMIDELELEAAFPSVEPSHVPARPGPARVVAGCAGHRQCRRGRGPTRGARADRTTAVDGDRRPPPGRLALAALVLRAVVFPRAITALWIALLGALLLASINAVDPLSAWIGTPDRRLGFLTWLTFPGLLLAGYACVDRVSTRVVLRASTVAGVVLGVWSTAELLGHPPLGLHFADCARGWPVRAARVPRRRVPARRPARRSRPPCEPHRVAMVAARGAHSRRVARSWRWPRRRPAPRGWARRLRLACARDSRCVTGFRPAEAGAPGSSGPRSQVGAAMLVLTVATPLGARGRVDLRYVDHGTSASRLDEWRRGRRGTNRQPSSAWASARRGTASCSRTRSTPRTSASTASPCFLNRAPQRRARRHASRAVCFAGLCYAALLVLALRHAWRGVRTPRSNLDRARARR